MKKKKNKIQTMEIIGKMKDKNDILVVCKEDDEIVNFMLLQDCNLDKDFDKYKEDFNKEYGKKIRT